MSHDNPGPPPSWEVSVRADPLKNDRKMERNVNRIKRWALLSAAGALALLLGNRAQGAVTLDHASLTSR